MNYWKMEKQKSLILDFKSFFFFLEKTFPFTHPRSENTPFFNAFFRANSVKMSLFVSRQMNWKALFSVTFWFGKQIFPKSRRQSNLSSMLKNWCCFSGCVGTAETIDEKDHHKLSRESVEHFMTKRLEI